MDRGLLTKYSLVLATVVVLTQAESATVPAPAPHPRTVTGVLDGPRVAAFDTARDSCEQIDIPDAAARAFRDYKGTVHLVASHYVMRQSVGPTLDTAKHNCQVAFKSPDDGNPADFNDYTWLDAFYSVDGKRVAALGHMEYHGWEHKGQCSQKLDNSACWYNADTFSLSQDGGYHFASPKAPANFVVGLPYKYQVDRGPEGYSVDTNIIKAGAWYYAMVTDWPWPPKCVEGKQPPGSKARECLVPNGGSPIRTANVLDPASWRGWNGKDFTLTFADPYKAAVPNPAQHIYTPVSFMYYVNAINIDEASHLFVATLCDPFNTAYGPEGIYLSTSPDMVNWTQPTLLVTMAQLRAKEPKGKWSYSYASLIDPKSTDGNFATITDSPYLYYVRMDEDHPPYVRTLFRQKIKLTWK